MVTYHGESSETLGSVDSAETITNRFVKLGVGLNIRINIVVK
jgi:hypothetical protein